MRYTLAPLTPLAIADAPVTLEEAKDWANVTTAEDDALVTSLVLAVTEQVEELTGLSFAARSYLYSALITRATVATAIDLPRRPVASVDSVTTYAGDGVDTALVVGTDYDLGATQQIRFAGLSLLEGAVVRVRFTTEAADVDERIRTAILRGVDQHYTWRSNIVGAGGAMRLPQQAMDLLLPHRRVTV